MVKLIENHTKQSEVLTLKMSANSEAIFRVIKPMSAIFLDEYVELSLARDSVFIVTLTDTEGMF